MRYALALDLVDDAKGIAEYETAHKRIWPGVRDHLREHGVLQMQIYRLGTRLFMVMDVDPAVYCAESMAQASSMNPIIMEWERLMWTYQVPTPWTPVGTKWMPMSCIFDLASQ